MPLKSEINPLPLMRKLAAAGAQLALPVVDGKGKPLIMRAWTFGEPLESGVWGIREPMADAPEVDPDILIVPLLAFDRRGHRLGYGAGYYDMTLTALRAKKPIVAVGIAFAAQEVDTVPITPRDARLDLVLTEREMIDFRSVVDACVSSSSATLSGRSGRNVLLERLPRPDPRLEARFRRRQRRERGRRLRHHRGDLQEFVDAGADVITGGNHSWDQREALVFIERAPKLLRPINYPPGTPGRGAALIEAKNGARVLVVNVMGRVFMDALDDPFAAVERELAACALKRDADAIIVDIHCEATSEKQGMGHFCDGRASLVVGTHTHAPTADHQVLPGGTAFISDVGMTGDYNSIIGMDKDEPLNRFLRKIPIARFEPALGEATLCGVAVETDDATGLARRIGAVRLGGRLEQAKPAFWG